MEQKEYIKKHTAAQKAIRVMRQETTEKMKKVGKMPPGLGWALAGARILSDAEEWKNPENPPPEKFRNDMVRGLRADINQHVRATFLPSLGKI